MVLWDEDRVPLKRLGQSKMFPADAVALEEGPQVTQPGDQQALADRVALEESSLLPKSSGGRPALQQSLDLVGQQANDQEIPDHLLA